MRPKERTETPTTKPDSPVGAFREPTGRKAGMARLFLLLCVTGILSAIPLASCSLLLPRTTAAKAHIVFPVAKASAITPTISPASYTLSFAGPATVAPRTTTESTVLIDLAIGSWDISVQAFDSAGKAIARGSRSGITIGSGENDITIILAPTREGTGSIDVTFTWPQDLSPGLESPTISLSTGGNAVPTATPVPSTYSMRYIHMGLASQDYVLTFKCKVGSKGYDFIQPVFQVYDNLTCSASIAFMKADFGQYPAIPTGLMATEGKGVVSLTWSSPPPSDISGYTIERSQDQANWPANPLDTVPTSVSYTDSTAVEGSNYYYRIKATNSVGPSPASSVVSGGWAPPDVTAGPLVAGTPTSTTVPLTWAAASDLVTAKADLEYKVVSSSSGNLDTVGTVNSATTVVDWTKALTSATASGLAPSTTYWFNVLVRDGAHNMTIYSQVSATTGAATSVTRIIDHGNYDPAGYSDAEIQAAAALKVYFEHASTGQDIMGNSSTDSSAGSDYDGSGACGLALLYAFDAASQRYLCSRYHIPEGGTNYPTWFATHRGLQTFRRGNPAPATKLSMFVNMSAEMRAAINVAMFKFCWIDVHPDTTGYVTADNASSFATNMTAAIQAFETANPGLTVVYWTMPVERDVAYAARQTFNDAIRAYCEANGKWLIDIADIESHDSSGNALTDVNGRELAYSDYVITDGGHLSTTGSIRMARAYWSLLAEIAKARASTP